MPSSSRCFVYIGERKRHPLSIPGNHLQLKSRNNLAVQALNGATQERIARFFLDASYAIYSLSQGVVTMFDGVRICSQ